MSIDHARLLSIVIMMSSVSLNDYDILTLTLCFRPNFQLLRPCLFGPKFCKDSKSEGLISICHKITILPMILTLSSVYYYHLLQY